MAGLYYKLNDKVTCPFNPAHVVNYGKFHNHFVKCKKAHSEDKRIQCPYNAVELIDEDKLEEHLLQCIFINEFPNHYIRAQQPGIFVDRASYNIEFGNKMENEEFSENLEDEDIDSISVIMEHQRLKECVGRGRGRGSLLKLLYSGSERKTGSCSSKSSDDNSFDFSSCDKNDVSHSILENIKIRSPIVADEEMPNFMKKGRGRGAIFREATKTGL